MNQPRVNPLVLMGLIGVFTIGSNFAVQVYRAYWGNQGNWWTPRTKSLSLEESRDVVRLSISGKRLQEHLEDGSLFARDDEGNSYRVVARDVSVRVNNWHKVKASILTNALVTGVAFGVVMTVLVIGLVQVIRRRGAADGSEGGYA